MERRTQEAAERFREQARHRELLNLRRTNGGALPTTVLLEEKSAIFDRLLEDVQAYSDEGSSREEAARLVGINQVMHYEMNTPLGNPRLWADVFTGDVTRAGLATNVHGERLTVASGTHDIRVRTRNSEMMGTRQVDIERGLIEGAFTAAEHAGPTGSATDITVPLLRPPAAGGGQRIHQIDLHTAPGTEIDLRECRPAGLLMINGQSNANFVFGPQTCNVLLQIRQEGMNSAERRLPPSISGPPQPQQTQAVIVVTPEVARSVVRTGISVRNDGEEIFLLDGNNSNSIFLSNEPGGSPSGTLRIAVPQEGVEPSRWRHVDIPLMQNGRAVAGEDELNHHLQAAITQLESSRQGPPTPNRSTGQQR
jgi:hypothetical protein